MKAQGIQSRKFFKNYTKTQNLYLQIPIPDQEKIDVYKARIIEQAFANNHIDFLKKCDHPLWQNKDFFISLPFKKNEYINPTKASHVGMNPEHSKLAQKECLEFIEFDLIEISDSQWACQAFYVNKISEQVRGKIRLVINYQL